MSRPEQQTRHSQHHYRREARYGQVKTVTHHSAFEYRMAEVLGTKDVSKVRKLLMPEDAVHSARINTLKLSCKRQFNELAERYGLENVTPIPWYPDGFTFDGNKKEIFSSEICTSGGIYIQNSSSFLPALALQPQAGDHILDVCAAPGGKAAHIAALTNNQAHIWVNDASPDRVQKITDVQGILGANFRDITCLDGRNISSNFRDKKFDRILLDAECSSESHIDLDDRTALKGWNVELIKKNARLQQSLLCSAFEALKPGGVLVYSTCTYAPEENEGSVSLLLREFEDAVVQPLKLKGANVVKPVAKWNGKPFHGTEGALRILPNASMEGFFVCRIRKRSDNMTNADLHPIDLKAEGIERSKLEL